MGMDHNGEPVSASTHDSSGRAENTRRVGRYAAIAELEAALALDSFGVFVLPRDLLEVTPETGKLQKYRPAGSAHDMAKQQ